MRHAGTRATLLEIALSKIPHSKLPEIVVRCSTYRGDKYLLLESAGI